MLAYSFSFDYNKILDKEITRSIFIKTKIINVFHRNDPNVTTLE